jgi:hypothetical protein
MAHLEALSSGRKYAALSGKKYAASGAAVALICIKSLPGTFCSARALAVGRAARTTFQQFVATWRIAANFPHRHNALPQEERRHDRQSGDFDAGGARGFDPT